MRFITEQDLRTDYKNAPFSRYYLDPSVRLTPGARQFIADRRIELIDPTEVEPTVKDDRPTAAIELSEKSRLVGELRLLEVSYLLVAEELLSMDMTMASEIVNLEQHLKGLRTNHVSELVSLCKAGHAIDGEVDFEGCVEISDFHIHLPQGRKLLLLQKLRSETELLSLKLQGCIEENNLDTATVLKQLQALVNKLTQLMCHSFGGDTCPKK